MGWWTFARATKMPTPGAMEYGLTDDRQVARPMIGPAIGAPFVFRTVLPLNYQTQALAVLTGIGGLAHGQSMLQPLSDPYNGDVTE